MNDNVQNDYSTLKAHYRFTKEDEAFLLEMGPQIETFADDFLEGFYEFIWSFGKTADFLKDEKVLSRHKGMIRQWYMDLFKGTYDITYFLKLYKIGETHVKLGLPTHYVNAAFNFVRVFTLGKIQTHCKESETLTERIQAFEKILDINLDVLTSSYRQEEMSRYLALSKTEKTLLGWLKKTSSYFNYLLAGALVIVASFAIGLFGYDVYLLFAGHNAVEEGILTILGSLLILWAAIELIHQEMAHLRGGSFALEGFITLAIAALIRKILIFSLSPAKSLDVLMYGGLVLCLGISYWLITHRPNPEKKQR
ncbi:MAG: phosphate-starvation-inducible PsiE family protein [Nitrospinaceae bacterium]|nr:phosphate-starvation-inducible PsiE family protein [Nitrospinaceae bacterium]